MGKKDDQNPFKMMFLTSAIVSQLAGSTLVGIFLGKWVDESLGTLPLFLIVGLFLGLTAGVLGTVHLVKKYMGDE